MNETALPLATSTWDEHEHRAIQEVIASGRFTMGPRVEQFEEEFARSTGARYAVMVNSGSSANLLAIAAAVLDPEVRLSAGDEVLVTAVSWATTYSPLAQYGLVPRFVDIDPGTLNMDPELAAEAVGPRTRAILAVNLLGNPNDFTRLQALAEAHDLTIIEDNCESLGATFEGRQAGTFGLSGTFSTFFSHHISTMEGGVVVTDDERQFHHLRSLRAHGWTRELPERNHVHDKTGDAFEDAFRFVLPGYNVRPLELSGALGSAQLEKVPSILAGRRTNAAAFRARLGGSQRVRIQHEVGSSSWFGFALVLRGELVGRRADLVRALGAAGIESRPIVAGNFARNPVIRHMSAVVPDTLPVADEVHDHGLFVGNHHYPVEKGLDRLAEVVETV